MANFHVYSSCTFRFSFRSKEGGIKLAIARKMKVLPSPKRHKKKPKNFVRRFNVNKIVLTFICSSLIVRHQIHCYDVHSRVVANTYILVSGISSFKVVYYVTFKLWKRTVSIQLTHPKIFQAEQSYGGATRQILVVIRGIGEDI